MAKQETVLVYLIICSQFHNMDKIYRSEKTSQVKTQVKVTAEGTCMTKAPMRAAAMEPNCSRTLERAISARWAIPVLLREQLARGEKRGRKKKRRWAIPIAANTDPFSPTKVNEDKIFASKSTVHLGAVGCDIGSNKVILFNQKKSNPGRNISSNKLHNHIPQIEILQESRNPDHTSSSSLPRPGLGWDHSSGRN